MSFTTVGNGKNSIRKILIILFGNLSFKFTLRCLQPDIVPIICHWCQRHRWQFATGVVDTQAELVAKFAAGVDELVANLPPVSLIPGAIFCHRCHWHRWQICHWCRWHRWCTLTCEYLREFSKKFEMTLLLFSGAWGKVIHEKNLKQKISSHCPFKAEWKQWNYLRCLLGSEVLVHEVRDWWGLHRTRHSLHPLTEHHHWEGIHNDCSQALQEPHIK